MEYWTEDINGPALAISILEVLAINNVLKKKKPRRRTWSKQWLINPQKYSRLSLLQKLKENNTDNFRNFLRMSKECFQHLLKALTPLIQRVDTAMWQPISPGQRRIATLLYQRIGRRTIKNILCLFVVYTAHICPSPCTPKNSPINVLQEAVRGQASRMNTVQWLDIHSVQNSEVSV